MSDPLLTAEEARVLGCLLEKEMTTPDYYPLTPNSLIAACNQSTNRDPVVSFDEATVEEALAGLRRKKLAAMLHLAGSRAPKYRHLAEEHFPGLGKAERSLLTVLLLRGPQTAAELRARTERMHFFPDNEHAETALQRLAGYQTGPLVALLPPGSGRRAATWVPLLSPGAAEAKSDPVSGPAPAVGSAVPVADWRTGMEGDLAALRAEVQALRERIAALETALGGV